MDKLLQRRDLVVPRTHFRLACAASRAWSDLLGEGLMRYGSQGPSISGAGRDHFPEPLKDALCALARVVTAEMDAAHAARPRGVHEKTIRALGRAVAGQAGAGYYGPQP